MLRLDVWATLIAATAMWAPPVHGSALQQATAAPQPPRATMPAPSLLQEPAPISHSTEIARREATVRIELSNGSLRSIELRNGAVFYNGERKFAYSHGGRLDRQFRALLERAGSLSTEELVFGLRAISMDHAPESAQREWASMMDALPPVSVTELPEASATAFAEMAATTEALVAEAVRGAEPVIAQEVERARRVGFGPERLMTDAAGLLGALIALSALGFGAIFFVPQRLEIVADTVARSPGRSFLAGLCAQPLILPALATLIIALVLTVVGVLVIPVAIILYALALAAGLVGGYLSVARVVGEIYVRRRGLEGRYTGGWSTYRYLVYGVIGLMAIWVPAALLSWVPVAGMILLLAASVFTWIMASAGLGAVILSRGGTRATFGSGNVPMLSTGSYWTVPQQATGSASELRTS